MKVEIKGKIKYSQILKTGTYKAQISEAKKVGNSWEYMNYSLLSKEIDLTNFEDRKVEVKANLLNAEIYKEKVQMTFWATDIQVDEKMEVSQTPKDDLPF